MGDYATDVTAALVAAEKALSRVRALVVWSDPGRQGGVPCVRGTRVPVDQITAVLDLDDKDILDSYPTVEPWQLAVIRALEGK